MKKILLSFFGFGICGLIISSPAGAADWTQDAGNAQRTGYTDTEPVELWTFKWSFNGADSNGGTANHLYNAPNEARTVTGGASIYVPAGSSGLYALNKVDGSQTWHNSGTFNAAPAYSNGFVYAGGADGNLYKIDAVTGTSSFYSAGSPINKAILVVEPYVYTVSNDGRLHKVNSGTMTPAWVYVGNSTAATPPSYSASRNIIVFATDDLFVHAVNNSDGSQKWHVKPTPNSPGVGTSLGGTPLGAQFERAYPVIADLSGIVLLRMQVPNDYIFHGPNNGRYGFTNSESRDFLVSNPIDRSLFALNLDNGSDKFFPAVGMGSTEDLTSGGTQSYGVMATQPVIKTLGNGKEIAYIPFRSAQTTPTTDYRWSGHMGEMVLDDTTVANLVAGDLRFIRMSNYQGAGGNSYTHIVDEQDPLTVAGNTLFFSHWSATTSVTITNRADTLGLTYTNPIPTSLHPAFIRAQSPSCGSKNLVTRFNSCARYFTDDPSGNGRSYSGSSWWAYWGVADPPGWKSDPAVFNSGSGSSYSAGFLPRYTFVANNLIVVEGNGGDIEVYTHSGSVGSTPTPAPASPTPSLIPTSTPSPTPIIPTPTPPSTFSILGLLQAWLSSNPTFDLNHDSKVNSLDFAIAVGLVPSPSPVASTWFDVGSGYTDVTPRQIFRASNDRVYIFTNEAEYKSILHAYVSTTSLPTSASSFTNISAPAGSSDIIQVDAAYDNGPIIHVFVNDRSNKLSDYPFDTTTNTFKPVIPLQTDSGSVTGEYLGTGGMSAMFDSTGKLHLAYWTTGNRINYVSYTYSSSANSLTVVDVPTAIDSGNSNHPHLVVSPIDNSVTVAWVSQSSIFASTKASSGTWSSPQAVNTSSAWTSTNSGLNIDQGPNMVIDNLGTKHLVYMGDFGSCGSDYGRIHYVTSTGTTWTDNTLDSCTHDPSIALRSNGDLYIIGHGHPSNSSCTNMQDFCTKKKNPDGSWAASQTFATHTGSDSFDASPSIKWSAVGWNRPDLIEFLFFRANAGSYTNTTVMYARL